MKKKHVFLCKNLSNDKEMGMECIRKITLNKKLNWMLRIDNLNYLKINVILATRTEDWAMVKMCVYVRRKKKLTK